VKIGTVPVDFARVRFGSLSLILSVLVAYKFQPLIHHNTDALNTIVTVFSILAGFLVAVITIVGDGVLIGKASWRKDDAAINGVKRRLTRHKVMFQVYLSVLAMVFVIQLYGKNGPGIPLCESVMLFLATFAFIGSLTMPGQLFKERMKKLESQRLLPPRIGEASKKADSE
jgi:hypothetical protein